MDLLAALPATIPLVLPSTTLAEVRHRSLPLYNRLQQLITEEDRHVWVFWNEQRRETATKVEYTTAEPDEDNEEEEEKPVAERTRESVNDRNDRGEFAFHVPYPLFTPHSHPPHTAILRNSSHVAASTTGIIPPGTRPPDRRPRQSHKSPRYGSSGDVDTRIRRWIAGRVEGQVE